MVEGDEPPQQLDENLEELVWDEVADRWSQLYTHLRASMSLQSFKLWLKEFFGCMSAKEYEHWRQSRKSRRASLASLLCNGALEDLWLLWTNGYPANDKRKRPGYDLYLETFCLQFLQLLYIIFGYTSMFAYSNVSLASQLQNNQFSGPMVRPCSRCVAHTWHVRTPVCMRFLNPLRFGVAAAGSDWSVNPDRH